MTAAGTQQQPLKLARSVLWPKFLPAFECYSGSVLVAIKYYSQLMLQAVCRRNMDEYDVVLSKEIAAQVPLTDSFHFYVEAASYFFEIVPAKSWLNKRCWMLDFDNAS